MLAVPNVRGALVPNISGSMGTDCRRHEGATAEKAVPFPSAARRSWLLRFGALNVLSTDGNPRMNEISRSDVFRLLSANQRLLERLEAEHGFGTMWRSSCSRFKNCARRSAIRSPKSDPDRCRRPSSDLISTVGPTVEDVRLEVRRFFSHLRSSQGQDEPIGHRS